MKTIQAYVTEDGQIFASEDKANLHAMFLEKQDVVDDFINSEDNPYKASAAKSIARSSVVNWEIWKVKNAK